MWIGKIQCRILVKTMDQLFADIAAGSKVFFNRGSDHTCPQGDAICSKLADQNSGRFRLGLFCGLNKRVRVDNPGKYLAGMIQIGFISNLNIQKIGIDRAFIKIAVVNDTQIHLGIWHNDAAVVIYIAYDGVTQVDGLDVSGDLDAVDGDIHPVSDIKRLEEGQDKSMHDIGQAFLKDKAKYHNQQRRRHQDGIIKACQGIGQAADLNEKEYNDQSLENAFEEIGMKIVFLFKISKAEIHNADSQKHQNYQKQCFKKTGRPQKFPDLWKLFDIAGQNATLLSDYFILYRTDREVQGFLLDSGTNNSDIPSKHRSMQNGNRIISPRTGWRKK